MSSNPNHSTPMITRDNYEEVFLLYVDDELTAAEKKAVDDFVALHPDLKEELDLLYSTKLPAETISFEGKAELLADSMKVNAVDETLLLYIDNELPDAAKNKVAQQLKADDAFALQHQLLLKAKLDKTEHIPYPNKKELYRHTERRIAPVWLRVAAAVVLLVSGTAVWMNMGSSTTSTNTVAVTTPDKTVQQPATATKPSETPGTTNEAPIVDHTTENVAVTNESPVSKKEPSVALHTPAPVKHTVKKAQATFSKAHADETPAVAANKNNNLPVVVKQETAVALQPDVAKKVSKPTLNNNPVVTSDATTAYVTVDGTAKTTVPVHAGGIETEQPEKSGGTVKGFLRKATRFIERRTGIKTVNDDDQLLVGAVALQL